MGIAFDCLSGATKRQGLRSLDIDLDEVDTAFEARQQFVDAHTGDIERLAYRLAELRSEIVGHAGKAGIAGPGDSAIERQGFWAVARRCMKRFGNASVEAVDGDVVADKRGDVLIGLDRKHAAGWAEARHQAGVVAE